METCNTISIDVDRLYKDIQQACLDLLYEVAEKIIKEFGAAIYEHGAGRFEWRQHAANEFKVLSEKKTREIIQLEVGIPEEIPHTGSSKYYVEQIMVALYGNHPPIGGFFTRPGEETFHNNMEDRRESRAQSVYKLPKGYNWANPHPEKRLKNAMDNAQTSFNNGILTILRDIKFSNYVYVTKR